MGNYGLRGLRGGERGEQPFLPQRAPTFAKATAGKQSFTEEIFLKYLNVGNPLPFASSRLCVRRLFDFFMSS